MPTTEFVKGSELRVDDAVITADHKATFVIAGPNGLLLDIRLTGVQQEFRVNPESTYERVVVLELPKPRALDLSPLRKLAAKWRAVVYDVTDPDGLARECEAERCADELDEAIAALEQELTRA